MDFSNLPSSLVSVYAFSEQTKTSSSWPKAEIIYHIILMAITAPARPALITRLLKQHGSSSRRNDDGLLLLFDRVINK
jgi:hypothetical protein